MQTSIGTPLFRFISTDITSTAIVDMLRPQLPVTKQNLFIRDNAVGVVSVMHSRSGMIMGLVVNGAMFELTAIEKMIIDIFYTQSK